MFMELSQSLFNRNILSDLACEILSNGRWQSQSLFNRNILSDYGFQVHHRTWMGLSPYLIGIYSLTGIDFSGN